MAQKQTKTTQEIAGLLRRFDDQPDPLHNDVTPSVLRLMELGLAGAEAVLDLLNSPELIRRRRAQRVLEGVVARRFGWNSSQGYPDEASREKALALLKQNGDYRADAAAAYRHGAIRKWEQWLRAHQKEEK